MPFWTSKSLMVQIYLHRNAIFFGLFLSAQLDFANIYLNYQFSPLLSCIKHINNHWNNGWSLTYPFFWHWSVAAFQVRESNGRRNRRVLIFPIFAGCNLSFRNSPGPFLTHFLSPQLSYISHFRKSFCSFICYHCSGKSTQWPSLTESFFWDFLAALGPHLREL